MLTIWARTVLIRGRPTARGATAPAGCRADGPARPDGREDGIRIGGRR
ncbi:MAG: hypothetical protein ACLPN6_24060 [Streptosporangiaceae bacterium]